MHVHVCPCVRAVGSLTCAHPLPAPTHRPNSYIQSAVRSVHQQEHHALVAAGIEVGSLVRQGSSSVYALPVARERSGSMSRAASSASFSAKHRGGSIDQVRLLQ